MNPKKLIMLGISAVAATATAYMFGQKWVGEVAVDLVCRITALQETPNKPVDTKLDKKEVEQNIHESELKNTQQKVDDSAAKEEDIEQEAEHADQKKADTKQIKYVCEQMK